MDHQMKRFALILMASLAFLTVSFAAPADQTFAGEVMDSKCAMFSGHDAVMNSGESAKDCTLRCVQTGGIMSAKYVLFDAAGKATYQLDDQKTPEQFAGAKVKVTGTYDASTKTIHVTKIEPAS